ncbi:hypothetical protein [Caballeronia mineralivorans]|uniref:hypothetical protein n=1 Tax=Caballeronia mineralivorans TaxID=2010198 RepID=UPI0023F541CB|nr:hypothetical protein [Caballeronia mineralivorans]
MTSETVDHVADAMKFEDCSFSTEHRFSIGRETDSGKYYLSIPVSNRLADYEEYYEITESDVDRFKNNIDLARQFAEKCRNRIMDHALIIKPGADRGIAT